MTRTMMVRFPVPDMGEKEEIEQSEYRKWLMGRGRIKCYKIRFLLLPHFCAFLLPPGREVICTIITEVLRTRMGFLSNELEVIGSVL